MANGPSVIISTPTGEVDASKATLPETGRRFRGAWRAEGQTAIVIDMQAAQELAREEIRVARVPLMHDLDVRYMRATETGAEVAEIVTAKTVLRDAPEDQRIAAARDEVSLAAAVDQIVREMQEAVEP